MINIDKLNREIKKYKKVKKEVKMYKVYNINIIIRYTFDLFFYPIK